MWSNEFSLVGRSAPQGIGRREFAARRNAASLLAPLQFQAALGDGQRIDWDLFGLAVQFQLEAVCEKRRSMGPFIVDWLGVPSAVASMVYWSDWTQPGPPAT